MSNKKKMVVVVTNGLDNERSSVAWSIANDGVASDYQVTMFLVSSGVDRVRKCTAYSSFFLAAATACCIELQQFRQKIFTDQQGFT